MLTRPSVGIYPGLEFGRSRAIPFLDGSGEILSTNQGHSIAGAIRSSHDMNRLAVDRCGHQPGGEVCKDSINEEDMDIEQDNRASSSMQERIYFGPEHDISTSMGHLRQTSAPI